MHHIGLTVSDIERSIAFYRDTLGLELVGRRPRVTAGYVSQQTGYDGVELNVASFRVHANSRQSIEMVQYMNHAGEPGDPATNRAGNTHLCLLVDDLRASVKDLVQRGVQFIGKERKDRSLCDHFDRPGGAFFKPPPCLLPLPDPGQGPGSIHHTIRTTLL